MTIRDRAISASFGIICVVGLASLTTSAQEPARGGASPKSTSTPATRKVDAQSRRVPDFFGQIGLTPEQREDVYKARGQHLVRIEALEAEIAKIRDQMQAECEAVLTDTQRQLFDQRRKATARPTAGPSTASKSESAPKI